jgi:3-oxoacyl-[acyl-carrier protein] reductase
MGRLDGKIAVITGGARGLGLCMAETFVREGALVITVDRSGNDHPSERIIGYRLDVSDAKGCEEFCKEIIAKYGHIDILINNAGITRDALINKMTDEMWDSVLAVNLKAAFNLCRWIGPHMMEKGSGSIINISSVVGEFGNIGQVNYSASKSALFGFSKSLAKELARKGAQVRCNAVAPGYTMTDMLKTVPQDLLDKFAKQTMLGRLGQPQDIANACLFLASDESSYITGQVISVNGGMRL